MDSGGNSGGSLQSSSGGDDSRCVDSESSSLSALLGRQSASPCPSFLGFGGSFYGLQELTSTTPLPPFPQAVHHWLAASSSHGMPAAADEAAPAPPRGSRKRTRASRRAPTTVLITDTTNFRAMVQEFTGVPSPPFATTPGRSRFQHHLLGSAPAPSSRFGAQLGCNNLLPSTRLQGSSDLLQLGTHLHPHELRDDELTGMFTGASGTGGHRSKTIYSPKI